MIPVETDGENPMFTGHVNQHMALGLMVGRGELFI